MAVGGASEIDATAGGFDIGATVAAQGSVTVDAAPGGSLASDAAVAISKVDAAALAEVEDATILDAAGTISVHSGNATNVTTIANGAPAAVAVSQVETSSEALLGGAGGSPGDVTATASQVSLDA